LATSKLAEVIIQNFVNNVFVIERMQNSDNKSDIENRLEESKKKTSELDKLKHDLEVELDDYKEENKYQQHVGDGELKVWNEKIKKKKELVDAETELVDKRKIQIEIFEKDFEKWKEVLIRIDKVTDVKPNGSEIKKLRGTIDQTKKQITTTTKKNREKIREKENEVLGAKNEMNMLVDQLEELNKQYRVNLHK
jgi:hypothetical protein